MNKEPTYYDVVLLSDDALRHETVALFALESSQDWFVTVDVESVLTIIFGETSDLFMMGNHDLMLLTKLVLIETLDLVHSVDELEVQQFLDVMSQGFAAYVRSVLQYIEEIGLLYHGIPGHFPYSLKQVLPSNDLLFYRSDHSA